MAEATITPAAVLMVTVTAPATQTRDVISGATVVAGQVVYLDANNLAKLAQSDGTALEATVAGVALHGAATGQPLKIAIAGDVTLDGLTAKKFYFASSTAGAMELESDIQSTEKISKIGYAMSATVLRIAIENTGLAAT